MKLGVPLKVLLYGRQNQCSKEKDFMVELSLVAVSWLYHPLMK
jgi:hypothetical protein